MEGPGLKDLLAHPMDRFFRVWQPIGVVAVLTTVIVVGVVTEPDRLALGFSPEQPIPFSHGLHAGDRAIPCLYCHSGALRSRHAGVPPLSLCMNCHRVTKTDSEHVRTITAAVDDGVTFPWVRIHAVPDHVYFDHRPHVKTGIACQECHGQVQTMEVVSRVMNMRMGRCLKCHRGEHAYLYSGNPEKPGPLHCWGCHR